MNDFWMCDIGFQRGLVVLRIEIWREDWRPEDETWQVITVGTAIKELGEGCVDH